MKGQKCATTIAYEWDIETQDKRGEVIDHYHLQSLADGDPLQSLESLVLVQDDADGRAWAYVVNGVLPENFTDAYDRPVARVPDRFPKELTRSIYAAK